MSDVFGKGFRKWLVLLELPDECHMAGCSLPQISPGITETEGPCTRPLARIHTPTGCQTVLVSVSASI